ncbi:hypothetical protein [Modestobacter sp. SYSU DS0290]
MPPLPEPAPRRRSPARRRLAAVDDRANGVPVDGTTCAACGHGKVAHEHYRRGTDCALCDCARYSRSLLGRLFRR